MISPAKGYNGPIRNIIGNGVATVDYWCPGCGSSEIHAWGDKIVCHVCGRAFKPILFGPMNDDQKIFDVYVGDEKTGSHLDRGQVSEELWYSTVQSEYNSDSVTELGRKYYGREPTKGETMDLATAIISSFDLRGYPDMLQRGESAILSDGIPVKVVRVKNKKPKGGRR